MSKALAAIARAKSDQILKESDAEASISSHDSEDETPRVKRLKGDSGDAFDIENGVKGSTGSSPNGVGSPQELMQNSLNGNHGELPKGLALGEETLAKSLVAGYHTYSPEQKQEVVTYAKETTVREAARKYNVPRSTVQVWCKHGGPVKRERRYPGVGGRRLSYSNETDDKLLQWVLKQQELGTPVTRDGIQAQARYLIREECPEFKASSGWVEKFLARHNLTIATKMSSANPNAIPIPISYVVPMSSVMTIPSPGSVGHGSNSPRADGRSFTSEETRSDSGKSEDEDDLDDSTTAMEAITNASGQALIREPPNLSELLKPLQPAISPASASLKDDEEDDGDGDGEDGEGEADKPEPANINPERLKAFNMFVRLFVDENLDRLVPISKQPKEKIMAIIHSCQRQFPEFKDRARKRIRTYLKSCRRMKKLKEPLKRAADQMNTNPNMSAAQMAEVNNILASACASEAENVKRPKLDDDVGSPASVLSNMAAVSATTTSTTSARYKPDKPTENGGLPIAKPKVLSPCQISPGEVQAIRQLIAGYRESAAFLYRSADELEALLPPV